MSIPSSVTSINSFAFNYCTVSDVYYAGTEAQWKAISINSNNGGLTSANIHCNSGSDTSAALPAASTTPEFTISGRVLTKYTGSGGNVTIPAGVTYIGTRSFEARNDVTGVNFPSGLVKVGENAFSDCNSLTKVILPEGTRVIDRYAFQRCGSLTAVGIPVSVTSINSFAFNLCTVSDVYYAGTEAQWKAISINSNNGGLTSANIHCNSTLEPDTPTTPNTPSTPDTPSTPTASFSDVPSDAYYAEAVAWAVENGVTSGTGSNKFSPNLAVTRSQAVTFLWRAAGSPNPKNMASSFSDVTDTGIWYYKAVLWACEQGITNGTGGGKFGVDAAVAYDQMLTFMCRVAGVDTSGDWSGKAIQWAKTNGLMTGLSFSAKSVCPRSDVVFILWKEMA